MLKKRALLEALARRTFRPQVVVRHDTETFLSLNCISSMAFFERRPSVSFEVQKATEAERDQKFVRAPARPKQRQMMPGILQVGEDEGSAAGSRPLTSQTPPSVVDPNRMVPFAGMRDQGKIPTKTMKLPAFGLRTTLAENIQQLGDSTPFSPASPASPSTIRSPLRFFRAREDVRDSTLAHTETAPERKPAMVLRERVKEESLSKMDQVHRCLLLAACCYCYYAGERLGARRRRCP